MQALNYFVWSVGFLLFQRFGQTRKPTMPFQDNTSDDNSENKTPFLSYFLLTKTTNDNTLRILLDIYYIEDIISHEPYFIHHLWKKTTCSINVLKKLRWFFTKKSSHASKSISGFKKRKKNTRGWFNQNETLRIMLSACVLDSFWQPKVNIHWCVCVFV